MGEKKEQEFPNYRTVTIWCSYLFLYWFICFCSSVLKQTLTRYAKVKIIPFKFVAGGP